MDGQDRTRGDLGIRSKEMNLRRGLGHSGSCNTRTLNGHRVVQRPPSQHPLPLGSKLAGPCEACSL